MNTDSIFNLPNHNQNMLTRSNINIIFYDGNLNTELNNNLCSYFKSNVEGTYYGVDDYNLFKYICSQIQKNNKCFILLSSGACAKDLFNYCEKKNIDNIYKILHFMCSYRKISSFKKYIS
jgi:hypothetical protein